MNTATLVSLIAIATAAVIAFLAHGYLAKRQPEYPNTRVIAVFALLGGSTGGLPVALLIWLAEFATHHPFASNTLMFYVYLGGVLGGAVGSLPATLCGALLAKKRLTRTRSNILAAAGYGALFGAAAGAVSLNPFAVLWLALAGGLSAAVLSVIALPKAKYSESK